LVPFAAVLFPGFPGGSIRTAFLFAINQSTIRYHCNSYY
jgi:hypothetical protein